MHITVLLHEAVEALQVTPEHWYIDGTFGRGGHTEMILQKGGNVVAFDVDQEAIEFGENEFEEEIAQKKLILLRENFEKIGHFVSSLNIKPSGALFDFGTSTDQLKDQSRGFSFEGTAELDMRMDNRLGVKAKDLLALLSEKQLADLFIEYGGEHEARRIAKSIVYFREKAPITTTDQLVRIIENAKYEKRSHLNPATKVFQALRIAVNSELDSIAQGLPQALELLEPGGHIVTIAFHEGEDRIVKQMFKTWELEHKGHHLTKDIIEPSAEELAANKRARSAKMRIFEKK